MPTHLIAGGDVEDVVICRSRHGGLTVVCSLDCYATARRLPSIVDLDDLLVANTSLPIDRLLL